MSIAQTITEQLGGTARLSAMIGVKNFIAHKDGVQFDCKRSNGINRVIIRLNDSDLYDVEFWSVRGINFNRVALEPNVQAASLKATIADATGLALSL